MDTRIPSDLTDRIVSEMSPGSTVVNPPQRNKISLLPLCGTLANIDRAISSEFCKLASPSHFSWSTRRFLRAFRWSVGVPDNALSVEARPLHVVRIEACESGFWSKNSAMNCRLQVSSQSNWRSLRYLQLQDNSVKVQCCWASYRSEALLWKDPERYTNAE